MEKSKECEFLFIFRPPAEIASNENSILKENQHDIEIFMENYSN